MPVVTVQIQNDDSISSPIEEVLVEFYDAGGIFQTLGSTDSNGSVSVTLPVGTYKAYMYKSGVVIHPSQPQVLVVSGSTENVFQVEGHIVDVPESTDPLRCTVYGNILGADGGSARTRLIFDPVKELTVLSGNVIAPNRGFQVSSDDDGYFQFEILRNTQYTAYFLFPQDLFGEQPGKLDVVVPDKPSVALSDLLFPVPVDLQFSASDISLVAGADQDESITVTVSFSDGSIRTKTNTAWAGVTISNSDDTVADVSLSDTVLVIKPLTTGTTTVTTIREIPTKVVLDPIPSYTSGSLIITVT